LIVKRTAKISILSLLLVVAILSAAPLVLAEEPTPRLPKMGPYLGPGDTDPFVGGYLDIPSAITKKVEITVSFPNTSPSVIPAGNYIAGGMFLQGKDKVVDNTDYGWVASLSLDHEGKFQYNMAFYETREDFVQCYWIIWQKAVVLDGVDPSTPVTLTMEWVEGCVEWFYTIDGNKSSAGLCDVLAYRSTIIQHFYIGTIWDWFKQIYFYQFGIYSETEIRNSEWTVRLEQPQYYASDDQWRLVFKAKFIQGYDSYMDNWWKWGGEDYDDVWARYYGHDGNPGTLPRFEVEFYYDPDAYLPSGWVMWDLPSLVWLAPWSDSELAYWDNVIAEYATEAGVEIQIWARSPEDFYNSIKGVDPPMPCPDILCMPAMWIPEFCDMYIYDGEDVYLSLLSVPPADVQDDVKTSYAAAPRNACEYIHTLWGYPNYYNSLALYYNKQILNETAYYPNGTVRNQDVANALAKLNNGIPLTWGTPSIGTGEFEQVAEACTDYNCCDVFFYDFLT